MASKHVSIPKSFTDGDAQEWFQRFEICAAANEWNNETKLLKLPTLLEGEALAVWLELSVEGTADYATAKKSLINKMAPTEFISLEEFHSRKLRPAEAIALYLHDLKRLLKQAMPGLAAEAAKPLLLHQFLAGLPGPISRQLRAVGVADNLDVVVERAKLLMAVDEQEKTTAAVSTRATEFDELKTQMQQLTEQVAALTTKQKPSEGAQRCYYCKQPGHTQRYCPVRRANQRCFTCGRPGHLARDCWQGNDQGMPVWGNRHPPRP